MKNAQPNPSEILLLVPTAGEMQSIVAHPGISELVDQGLNIRLCGFGLLASALITTRELAAIAPAAVILAGIAGATNPAVGVGDAIEFQSVVLRGIGVGSGAGHQSAKQMGWEQFQGIGPNVADEIELGWPVDREGSQGQLVSVCSASANDSERKSVLEQFPLAFAEDMEGYAVAAACQLAEVPIRIVRGISNRAGDRDHASWKSADALEAAAAWVAKIIRQATAPQAWKP